MADPFLKYVADNPMIFLLRGGEENKCCQHCFHDGMWLGGGCPVPVAHCSHELSGDRISPSSSCQVVFVLEGTMEAGGMGMVGVWL